VGGLVGTDAPDFKSRRGGDGGVLRQSEIPLRGSRKSFPGRIPCCKVGAKTLTASRFARHRHTARDTRNVGFRTWTEGAHAVEAGASKEAASRGTMCAPGDTTVGTSAHGIYNGPSRLARLRSTSVLTGARAVRGRPGPNGLGKRKRSGGDSSSRRVGVKPRDRRMRMRGAPSHRGPLQFGSTKPNCAGCVCRYGRFQGRGDCDFSSSREAATAWMEGATAFGARQMHERFCAISASLLPRDFPTSATDDDT
jgi:hypothetical protein